MTIQPVARIEGAGHDMQRLACCFGAFSSKLLEQTRPQGGDCAAGRSLRIMCRPGKSFYFRSLSSSPSHNKNRRLRIGRSISGTRYVNPLFGTHRAGWYIVVFVKIRIRQRRIACSLIPVESLPGASALCLWRFHCSSSFPFRSAHNPGNWQLPRLWAGTAGIISPAK